jgi:hypothetical protein
MNQTRKHTHLESDANENVMDEVLVWPATAMEQCGNYGQVYVVVGTDEEIMVAWPPAAEEIWNDPDRGFATVNDGVLEIGLLIDRDLSEVSEDVGNRHGGHERCVLCSPPMAVVVDGPVVTTTAALMVFLPQTRHGNRLLTLPPPTAAGAFHDSQPTTRTWEVQNANDVGA